MTVDEASSEPATVRAPRAHIHDLGYKRFVGTRRPQSTRWRVLVRNLVSTSWRGWWRMKLWVIGAVLVTGVIAVLIERFQGQMFKQFATMTGAKVSFADSLVAYSYSFYVKPAFLLTLSIGATLVGKDLQAGAFEFYFSRPVRPLDYVIGKVVGMVLIMGIVLFVGPVILTLIRVGLSADAGEAREAVLLVPRTLVVSTLATLLYAIAPFVVSLLSANPRHCMIVWATIYVVGGFMLLGISQGLDIPALMALDPAYAVNGLTANLYDVFPVGTAQPPPLWASLVAIAAWIGAGIAALWIRVSRAHRAGLGGG